MSAKATSFAPPPTMFAMPPTAANNTMVRVPLKRPRESSVTTDQLMNFAKRMCICADPGCEHGSFKPSVKLSPLPFQQPTLGPQRQSPPTSRPLFQLSSVTQGHTQQLQQTPLQPSMPTFVRPQGKVIPLTVSPQRPLSVRNLNGSPSPPHLVKALISNQHRILVQKETPQLKDIIGVHLYTNLEELLKAFDVPAEPLVVHQQNRHIVEASKWMCHGIKQLVDRAKRITSFSTLLISQQEALLKGNMTCLLLLKSVTLVDLNRSRWLLKCARFKGVAYEVAISIEVFRELTTNCKNMHLEYMSFIDEFRDEWRQDKILTAILFAMTLFNPDGPSRLLNDRVIKTRFNTYESLFNGYLQFRYGDVKGKLIVSELATLLAKLRLLRTQLESSHVFITDLERNCIHDVTNH